MTEKNEGFDKLWSQVSGDMKPVRPLAPPWRRAAGLALWSLISLVGTVTIFGLRDDCSKLGPLLSWTPSVVALGAAYVLLWLVGRESIPGAGIRPLYIVLWALGACVLHLVVARLTYQTSPATVPPEHATPMLWGCALGMCVIGIPVITLGILIARQGLVIRPWTAGLLTGVAAGCVADAVWRMHCPYTGPAHFLAAHTLPYCVLIGVGFVILWRNARARGDS